MSSNVSPSNTELSNATIVFGATVCRWLGDRSYERRKQAGTEIEDAVRETIIRRKDLQIRNNVRHFVYIYSFSIDSDVLGY